MDNKEKNFVSVVIYVHNAEKQLELFLKMIIKVLENNFEHSEIICVNDFSDDGSVQMIKKASVLATTTSVSVINLSYFHGLEVAMDAGVDMAIGDFVFEFDSMFWDFEECVVMQIYHRCLEGYDIVSAAPDKKEKITSKMFYRVFDRFADSPYKMHTERFRILSRRVINRICSMNRTNPYRKVSYANCGLQTDNLRYPVTKDYKEVLSKRESRYRFGLAVDSLILFTEFGYRFSRMMTGIMMFVTIFVVVYSLVTYFFFHPIEGWTTTILFLSIAFFGLFGILTIVVKYLQLLINMVFKRKYYSFTSIEKITK